MMQCMKNGVLSVSRKCGAVVILCCAVLVSSGCAQLPIAGRDSSLMTSAVVAHLSPEPLYAAAPGGKRLAFAGDGVRIVPLPTGESRLLSKEHPLALAWSPDGGQLAVAFANGMDSRIIVFSPDNVPTAETSVIGRIGALSWPEKEALFAVSMELEKFKFGTSCREILLRWQPGGMPERKVLHEVTLRPDTLQKWGVAALVQAVSPLFSPLGDELVYGRLQDPPVFEAPSRRVMLRNIPSGAEREVVRFGFTEGTVRFSADSEELYVYSGSDRIERVAAWSGVQKQPVPFSGRLLTVSPDGVRLLADGRLLEDNREVALFPPGSTGIFLDDGRLLMEDNGTLFLVSGFVTPIAGYALSPEKLERLRTIRAWRASGLVSADDYISAREKVMK